MWKHWGLAAAISIMATAPAWADVGACGGEPIPPAVPSVAEIGEQSAAVAQKTKHQTFLDIRAWQASLKDYRGCLDSDQKSATQQLQDAKGQTKPDTDKIARLQAEIDGDKHAYDRSSDTEEKVVNDFNALSTAYCARPDTDKASCPKA